MKPKPKLVLPQIARVTRRPLGVNSGYLGFRPKGIRELRKKGFTILRCLLCRQCRNTNLNGEGLVYSAAGNPGTNPVILPNHNRVKRHEVKKKIILGL